MVRLLDTICQGLFRLSVYLGLLFWVPPSQHTPASGDAGLGEWANNVFGVTAEWRRSFLADRGFSNTLRCSACMTDVVLWTLI